jgi:hypothetical protein
MVLVNGLSFTAFLLAIFHLQQSASFKTSTIACRKPPRMRRLKKAAEL